MNDQEARSESGLEECTRQLNAELLLRGIHLDRLLFDGSWHAFKWGESDTKKKGSYRALQTEYGVDLVFKNWKDSSLNFTLRSEKRSLTPEEREEHQKRLEEFEAIELKKKILRWETAAIEAERAWSLAEEPTLLSHPYFQKKHLKATYGTRISRIGSRATLLIPLRDLDGKLWGLEKIDHDGEKMGLTGMRKEGCFHLIGQVDITKPLFICEGFATAASLFESKQYPAVCAFSATNFLRVGEAFRAHYGRELELIFSGDNDRAGKEGSRKASKKLEAKVLIPKFRSPHPDYNDWNDLKDLEGEGTVKDQVEAWKTTARSTYTQKQDWMREFLEEHEVSYKYSGQILVGNEKVRIEDFLNQMILSSDRDGIKIPDRILNAYLGVWISERKKEEWMRVVNLISPYEERGLTEVKEWVRCLTGSVDPIEVSVMLHFIWQAKRKALGLKVSHHMMPVFTGKTGGGKSEAIKLLISPLSPLSYTASLSVCSDPRESRLFGDCLVLNMDEMENAEKTDLQGLKRTITAEELTYRILSTNLHDTVENRATLVGSSNESLDFLIKDPTSIRRFYSIETLPFEKLSKNWETLNRLDYTLLWRSVDPHAESPLALSLSNVRDRQESMRYQTDVELWVESSELIIDPNNFQSNESLMKSYTAYSEKHGNQFRKGPEALSKELVRLGFRRGKISQRRGFYASFMGEFNS
jgi:phage/plasmid primase-like uncharacterized protein